MLGRLARRGDDLEAGVGQQRDGGAADAAGRAGDQHRAVVGRRAVLAQPAQREQRGEAGQADDGGVAAAQRVRAAGPPSRPGRGRSRRSRRGAPRRGRSPGRARAGPALNSGLVLSSTSRPARPRGRAGTGGPPGCPGRVTIASLKLMAVHSTRIRTSPGGQVAVGELDDGGADHLAGLGEQVGREAHRLTVEAVAAPPARGSRRYVRTVVTTAAYGRWASPLGAARRRRGPRSRSPSCARTARRSTGSSRGRPRPGASCSCGAGGRSGSTETTRRPGVSIRSRVHEYGGGAVCLVPGRGAGAVRLRRPGGPAGLVLRRRRRPHRPDAARPLSARAPEGERHRHGGLGATPDGDWVLAVREVHRRRCASGRHAQRRRPLDSRRRRGRVTLLEGHDFFGAPRVDARGSDSPSWRGTTPTCRGTPRRSSSCPLGRVGRTTATRRARARPARPGRSPAAPTSRWGSRPGGRDGTLRFVSDRRGWWQPYVHPGTARRRRAADGAAPTTTAEFHGPDWVLGQCDDGGAARRHASWLAAPRPGATTWSLLRRPAGAAPDVARAAVRVDQRRSAPTATGVALHRQHRRTRPRTCGSWTVRARRGPPAPARRPPTSRSAPARRRGRRAVHADRALRAVRCTGRCTGRGRRDAGPGGTPRRRSYVVPRRPDVVAARPGSTSPCSSSRPVASPWPASTTPAAPAMAAPTAARCGASWGVADAEDCLDAARHLADARRRRRRARMAIRGGSAGGMTALNALAAGEGFTACVVLVRR